MSIRDLPDELLLRIFKPFVEFQRYDHPFNSANTPNSARANTRSLARFSRVCVRWHIIIEPMLYSTFTKPSNGVTDDLKHIYLPDQDIFVRVAKPNQSLRLFLRTIIERPHLAGYIKKLVLGSWIDSIRLQDYNKDLLAARKKIVASGLDPALRRTYQEGIQKVGKTPDSLKLFVGWPGSDEYILSGDEGSELALLLLLTSSVRKLYLAQMPLIEDWTYIVTDQLTFPSHLRRIHLGTAGNMLEVRGFRLCLLMTLPSLRALVVYNCRIEGIPFSHRRSSRLIYLKFSNCAMRSAVFESLTEQVSHIQTFEWTGRSRSSSHLSSSSSSSWPIGGLAQIILNFLERQRSSLRCLKLHEDELFFIRIPRLSFKQFESMEEIRISRDFLEGWIGLADQLPQSLKHLTIIASPSHITNKLVTLVSSRALPLLKRIDYGPVVFPASRFETTQLRRLEDVCVREGIVLRNTVGLL